jgi:hypothetical protein
MSNSYLDRASKTRTSHGTKAERKTAKRLGGKAIPGSGNISGLKGDIDLPDFLVENKCTDSASLSLKLSWLEKISTEARDLNKAPALCLQFVSESGEPRLHGKWVMIREVDFVGMTEGI